MQPTLNDFAQKLAKNPIRRQFFFLTAALASIALIGYHFGSLDQAVHIPFLKATADPGLYPTDPFLLLRNDQFSFFWYFFLPFLKAGVLEPAMFLVHVLGIFLFFTAVWELSMTLFGEPLAALFASLAFIVPHTGFVGFPLIEFSLQSRTLVLPFLIMAITCYLKDRKGIALLILGLMYNLNLLMTNFALAILIFDSLFEIRKNGWQKFVLNLGMFLIGALPVLIWKFSNSTGFDFSLRREWFSAISSGGLFQIFHILSTSVFMLLTLGGFSCLALFFIAQKNDLINEYDRRVKHFMAALIGTLTFQVITTLWMPLTIIIQLQISRASIFILIFAYIYFANYLAQSSLSKKIASGNFTLLACSYILSVSPIIPLMARIGTRIKPTLFGMRKYASLICLSLMLVGYMATGLFINLWQPGIHIYGRSSDWVDVQNWARENTPKESVFITPPQEGGLYQPDWRVLSERGTVASLYDVFEIALKPEYYETWEPRFESLAPTARNDFRGNFFENQKITREAFNGLKTDQILAIAKRYNASFLVIEKVMKHDLPVVYENGQYRIYELNKN